MVKWFIKRLVVASISSCAVFLGVAQSAEMTLLAEPVQGSLVRGVASPGASVTYHGQALEVGPAGEFVFGIGRDATGSRELVVTDASGKEIRRKLDIVEREFNIQRIEGIAKRIMNPKPEDIERAKKDNRMVAAARAPVTERLDFMQDFIWPVEGPISGVYGSQRFYNGEPRRPHYGIDIAVPTGTEVVAPADGTIMLWVPDMFYSGGTMIIDHGFGVNSTFLHLSGSLVKEGDEVKQGQPVALVGASGRVTGPHLDWRMNWKSARVDPELLVPPMPSAN
ncbi:periplasmic metalloprotease M23B family protein [Neiella marina]|uniref:Periplasmic metalloprotease M23B family protein n=1 Tax=Neiella marina TaxID=508461 RepID=A0A8J2U999_9GAMM|nr:M23 family metallopeptidase [Neiella marina]GGA87022.1 periplasmic metalloprotease M23B family protein [Neiella marina]